MAYTSTAKQEKIDTGALKSRVNLIEIARQHTTLKRWSIGEYAGPCLKCGGDDRFHVKEDGFFCRQCHPGQGGTSAEPRFEDAIEYMRWVFGLSFLDAVQRLSNGSIPTMPAGARPAAPKPVTKKPETWRDETWQKQKRRMMDTGTDALQNLSAGQIARDELARRCITLETAQLYQLGYMQINNPMAKQKMPAILIPWFKDEMIANIQCRFISVTKADEEAGKAQRFKQIYGGTPYLFGVQNCIDVEVMRKANDNPDYMLSTLIITESEVNAISCNQAIRNMQFLTVGVVSFGSESNIDKAEVITAMQEQAQNYRHIIALADRPEKALKVRQHIPQAHPFATGERDANELMQQGRLEDFIWWMLQKVGAA